MEKQIKIKKCSSKNHLEINAIFYCKECKIYMCDKCQIFHNYIFSEHHINLENSDKDLENIFSGICKEQNHPNVLEFYCKDHNKLCCASCIIKLKKDGYGQHSNCNICNIENIEEEKRTELNKNNQCLEKLLESLEQSLDELKNIFDKLSENKEKIKLEVQKIFTKIRNTINDREDELLLEIDKKYDELFFNEDLIKESKSLPKVSKINLEKGKLINKEWNKNNTLNSLINDCIIIENNIKDINYINEKIDNSNSMNLNIKFSPEESGINNFIKSIKSFGNIYYHNFKFKDYNNNKYQITGKYKNIVTNNKKEQWICIQCENELEKEKEYIWKIKILRAKYNHIMVGVSPILSENELNNLNIQEKFNPFIKKDEGNNMNMPKMIDLKIRGPKIDAGIGLPGVDIKVPKIGGRINLYGWYFYCFNSTLYSDSPYNFKNKKTNLGKIKDEIKVIMNMKKRTLYFKIDNEDEEIQYIDIPIDYPITPSIILYDLNDSVEIIEE